MSIVTDHHAHRVDDIVIDVDVHTRDHMESLKQMHRHYYGQRLKAEQRVEAAEQQLVALKQERERLRATTGSLLAAIEHIEPDGSVDHAELFASEAWEGA